MINEKAYANLLHGQIDIQKLYLLEVGKASYGYASCPSGGAVFRLSSRQFVGFKDVIQTANPTSVSIGAEKKGLVDNLTSIPECEPSRDAAKTLEELIA